MKGGDYYPLRRCQDEIGVAHAPSLSLIGVILLGPLPLAAQSGENLQHITYEELRIGSAHDPAYALTDVGDLAIGRDGAIFVLQPLEQLVRVYGSDGVFRRAFGGRGEGPGEFLAPNGLGWKGDTLWVTDRGLLRISFFTELGHFVRSENVSRDPYEKGHLATVPEAVLPDGSYIVAPEVPMRMLESDSLTLTHLLLVDAVTSSADRLAAIDLSTEILPLSIGSGDTRWRFFPRQPFAETPLWNTDSRGAGAAIVEWSPSGVGGKGESDTARVTRLGSHGEVIYVVSIELEPVRLHRALRRTTVDSLGALVFRAAAGRLPSEAAARKEVEAKLHAPTFVPPVIDVVAGEDGTIWLRTRDREAGKARWLVLGRGGAVACEVLARDALVVLRATRDRIWAVEYDRYGVPYVIRARIPRGGCA